MTSRPVQLLSVLMVLVGVAALGAERPPVRPARPTTSNEGAKKSEAPARLATSHSEPATDEEAPAVRRQWMEVTAYCPCTRCCGENASGITASGLPVTHNDGHFVAADTKVLPMGAQISIPGYHQGRAVPVIDRGGAIKGNRIDLFFPTHEEALQWGRRWVLVEILPD